MKRYPSFRSALRTRRRSEIPHVRNRSWLSDDGAYAAKLVDFGIAKVRDAEANDATATGEIFGTPNYMSPEQAQGLKISLYTDQYALGCVIFEMLTGTTPFVGTTSYSVITQHVNALPPTLAEAVLGKKKFAPALEDCVAKLLAKDQNSRYQSMAEAKSALMTNSLAKTNPAKKNTEFSSLQKIAVLGIGACTLAVAVIISVAPIFSPPQRNLSTPQQPDTQAIPKAAVAVATVNKVPENVNANDEGTAFETQQFLSRTVQIRPPIKSLVIEDATFSPKNARLLRDFKGLEFFRVAYSGQNADLALENLNKNDLLLVGFEHSDVSSAGIANLKDFKRLKGVYLVNCHKLVDRDLETIARLPQLIDVNISQLSSRTPLITEAGVKALIPLKGLRT